MAARRPCTAWCGFAASFNHPYVRIRPCIRIRAKNRLLDGEQVCALAAREGSVHALQVAAAAAMGGGDEAFADVDEASVSWVRVAPSELHRFSPVRGDVGG